MLLALAWLSAQPATRAQFLLAAVSLGHGHAHSLALVSDGRHFDAVLSHTHTHDELPAGSDPSHPYSCSKSDHVVHFGEDPALREPGRRIAPPVPLLLAAQPAEVSPPATRMCVARGATRWRAIEVLETVVLRC